MSKGQNIHNPEQLIGKIQKDIENSTFRCLCQNCYDSAISSHSQQKEGQLRAIAKEGLVYALNNNFFQHIKNLTHDNKMLLLIKTGVKEASVFKGYCSFHDDLIFRPIEKSLLKPSDREQAALLFLRAISYEYATKRKQVNIHRMLKNMIGDDSNGQGLSYLDTYAGGMELYLKREGPFLLNQIFNILTKRDYGGFHTSWIRHPHKLPISVTTSVCPCLNDYYSRWSPDNPQAVVSFSVIPSDNYTDVVCSWLNYCHDDSMWIQEEMKSIEGLEKIVNLFGISESEDFCINIDFWESLEEDKKEKVIFNMHLSVHKGSTGDVPMIIKLKN
jgi:hypothetical protein